MHGHGFELGQKINHFHKPPYYLCDFLWIVCIRIRVDKSWFDLELNMCITLGEDQF